MLFLRHDSTDANFNFALEKYAMYELDASQEYLCSGGQLQPL